MEDVAPIQPGPYTHAKSGKIVLVRCTVMLQDDVDGGVEGEGKLSSHGPYDGEEWVLYEHDGKAFCRKKDAFSLRFVPLVHRLYDDSDAIMASAQSEADYLASLTPWKRFAHRLGYWGQVNLLPLVSLLRVGLVLFVINILVASWKTRLILYLATLGGTWAGSLLSRQPLVAVKGRPVTIPWQLAEALSGNEWVPLREDALGGLGGSEYDAGPVDYSRGAFRCPWCQGEASQGHKNHCDRGRAMSWLRGALVESARVSQVEEE